MYRGRRNVTRVQGSVTGYRMKVLLLTWKNEWAQKYNRDMSSLLLYILGNMNVATNTMINPFVNWLRLVDINSWRLVYRLTIRHQWQTHSIIQYRWHLSTLMANSVKKIGVSYPPHSITHKPLWWPWLDVLVFWAANQVVHWLSVSPGRWGWSRIRIPQQTFSGLIVAGAASIWCTKQSGPFRYCCLTLALAIDCDHIAVGLSLSLRPFILYYSRSHKMKGTTHPLFEVAMHHRLVTGHATRNRGVILITGVCCLPQGWSYS